MSMTKWYKYSLKEWYTVKSCFHKDHYLKGRKKAVALMIKKQGRYPVLSLSFGFLLMVASLPASKWHVHKLLLHSKCGPAYPQSFGEDGNAGFLLLSPVLNARGLWCKALKTLLIEIKPVRSVYFNEEAHGC